MITKTSVVADEGVYADGTLIGRVTSGGFSYFFDHDIAMVLVAPEFAVEGFQLQVLIHNELRDAIVVSDSMYDPTNARARM